MSTTTKAKSFGSSQTAKLLKACARSFDSVTGRQVVALLSEPSLSAFENIRMPDPSVFDCPSSFAREYAGYNLVRKLDVLPLGVDTEAAAEEKFAAAEAACAQLNKFGGFYPFVFEPRWGALEEIISIAREKIKNVLGKVDLDEIRGAMRFSGGASTRFKRASASPAAKYSGKPHVTRNAALMAICAIWTDPLWAAEMREVHGPDPFNWVTIVSGSRKFHVDKTAKVKRTILAEPELNMYIQLGIGSVIRSRLLSRARINLNNQTENQRLALIGSRTGSLATIDLEAASDSISIETVRALLPAEWFDLLMLARSPYYEDLDGSVKELQKISAMGNGYTFELESLIFWGLVKACIEVSGVEDKRLGVYGDDLICHHEAVPLLTWALSTCGFRLNAEKSFWSGPFRESCGKHYFHGIDVTPFYCKEQVESDDRVYWLANSYASWCARLGLRHMNTYKYIVSVIPKGRLCRVPASFGPTAGLIIPGTAENGPVKIRYLCRVKTRRELPADNWNRLAWYAAASSPREEVLRTSVRYNEGRHVIRRKTLTWWDPCDFAGFFCCLTYTLTSVYYIATSG